MDQDSCKESALRAAVRKGYIKEIGSSQSMFECSVCHCSISGRQQAKDHAFGTKHIKASYLYSRCNNPVGIIDMECEQGEFPSPNLSDLMDLKVPDLSVESIQIQSTDYSKMENSDTYCKICNVAYTGPDPRDQHMAGKAHLKKLRASCLSSSSSPSLKEMRHSSPENVKVGLLVGSARRCSVCDIEVNGDKPWEQHVKGKAHEKNLMKARFFPKRDPECVVRDLLTHSDSNSSRLSSVSLATLESTARSLRSNLALNCEYDVGKRTIKQEPQPHKRTYRVFKAEEPLPIFL